MTEGIRDLRRIEIGFQGVGTGVVCDTPGTMDARIVGTCGMKKMPTIVFPTEATGLMSDHIINRAYEPYVMAELPIAPGDEGLTYEQLVYYLAMGIKAGITGAAGVGAEKTWTFAPDLALGDFPEVASIRYGDNVEQWQADCCFARELKISGAFQGPWQIAADIVGRDMAHQAAGFHGIAYPATLNTILGQLTSFYLQSGPCTNRPGARITGSLIDWTVTIPGFHPKFFQDNQLYYTAIGLASRHLTLEATIEFESALAAIEHGHWITRTPRYVRIRAEGAAIDASQYTAQIDMNLMYESFETLDQRDGNDTVKFVARTVYDVDCVAVPEWEVEVINRDATLPNL